MTAKLEAKASDRPTPQESELTRRIAQLERENRRLRERCEEAELENAALERSLKKTESTVSFRLGHALIQSTKSLDGLRALPVTLAELRRGSQRRKRAGTTRQMLSALAGRLARFKQG